MLVRILSDITKMLCHGSFYIHLSQSGAQGPCQGAGIVVGSVRGSEAGHGHRGNVFPFQSQQVEGTNGHQQRQCGIQSSGDTNDRTLTSGMLKSLLKSVRLNG